MNLPIKLTLLVILGILLIGCERKKPPLLQALEENETWASEFTNRYPEPLPPFDNSPSLGNTGNFGITKDLQFVLRNFPAEKFPELEAFVVPKLRGQGLQTVTIMIYVPAGIPQLPDVMKEVTLKYYDDGRMDDSRLTGVLAGIPEANINGRPLKSSGHTGAEPPAKVAAILKAIPNIKKDERRDVVFKRLGLWDDELIRDIGGSSGMGVTDEIWDLSEDGLWLLEVISHTEPDEDISEAEGGKLVGFSIYHRREATPKLDWKKLERVSPYMAGGKLYPADVRTESNPVSD